MGVTIKDLNSYNSIANVNYGETVVFLKFGADWCVPCIELDKILVNIPNSLVYHISIENEDFESFFIENNIYTIPVTIIKYKNKSVKFQGISTKEKIIEMIEKLKIE
tara:strand:+ start:1161 stop:1481 length:321 start_codon:yes stop_codon:yes gene_type:complete